MIITFAGHGILYNSEHISQKINTILIECTQHDSHTSFYCGGYGDFDHLCAKACAAIRDTRQNCEVIFVTPYITESRLKYQADPKLYNATIYPPLENVPLRFAIRKRNEWMVDQADLVIAYVAHKYGGAYQTPEYARRKKKIIINLADQTARTSF
ncbi:MAG: hypothetical protein IJA78_02730 [Clostridia bacterium]|nr:hypothetical protein [Clostridia bacterium]